MYYAVWTLSTAPTASFIYSVDDLTVQFTDTSISPNIWQWNFGDTVVSTSQNPTHTYSEPGNYTVTLTISNATGESSSFSSVVSVGGVVGQTYTVSFNSDGGSSIDPMTAAGGTMITLPLPERSGYTFAGWHFASVLIGNAGSKYTVQADITLLAVWQAGNVPVYSVTFRVDGQTVAVQKVISGGKATFFTPEKNGFSFDGWFLYNPAVFGSVPFSFGTEITSDTTLDANFSKDSGSLFLIVIIVIVMTLITILAFVYFGVFVGIAAFILELIVIAAYWFLTG